MIKRKIIILLFIVVFSVFGFYIYSSWLANTEPFIYDKKLADVSIKTLKVENKKYSIISGKIKPSDANHTKVSHLAQFYLWIKEDPLFYSPDLDLKGLTEAVDSLDRQQNDFLKNIKQTQHLYPTDFLKEMVKTSQLTDQFLKDPSDSLAYLIIDQYRQTTKAYGNEAETLVDFLSNIQSVNTIYTTTNAILINITTNSKIMLDDIKKIAQNTNSLEEEINLREKCLIQNQCQRPSLNFPKPNTSLNASNQTTNTTDIIEPTWVFNLSNAQIKNLKRQKLLRGIYQTKSPCFGLNEDFSWPNHLFYLNQVDKVSSDSPRIAIPLSTDIFFRKIRPDSEVAGDKELVEQGIKYAMVDSDNAYMCPYLGYLAEVSTMDLFLQKNKPILIDKNIFAPGSTGDFFNQAKKDEKDFFESSYFLYHKLDRLADDYGFLYKLLTENPQTSWAKSLNPVKEDLLKRHLSIKRRLGQINLVFNRATQLVKGSNLRIEVNPKDPVSVSAFVYTYRNFYGLYYMPFSPSIWRSNESLQYLEKKLVTGAIGPAGGWINYHQALEIYSPEEIKRWFTSRREIVEEKFERLNGKK